MDPNFGHAHQQLISMYEQNGELGKAIEERQRARSLLGEKSEDVAREANSLRKAYAEKGVRGYWLQRLEWFRANGRNPNAHQAIFLAIVNTPLGNKDEAFRCLE